MKYSKAFSYVFEDSNWITKILIAGLIGLIPIVGQLYLAGWTVEIVRRVKAGRTDILPATHFAYFLTLGLKMFVVVLIYSLPFSIITSLLSLVNQSTSSDSSGFVVMIVVSISCLGSIISCLLGIALSLLTTYGTIKLAETDQIKPCLNLKEAYYCIRDNIKPFIIVMLLHIVISIIAPLGLMCLIGVIFTAPYAAAVSGHLTGQLWDNLEVKMNRSSHARGSVSRSTNDIIEEAPFTKVQDIEEDLGETYQPAAENPSEPDIVIPQEPVEDAESEEETVESTEEPNVIYGEAPEADTPHADEETETPSEGSGENQESKDDDIPSFE